MCAMFNSSYHYLVAKFCASTSIRVQANVGWCWCVCLFPMRACVARLTRELARSLSHSPNMLIPKTKVMRVLDVILSALAHFWTAKFIIVISITISLRVARFFYSLLNLFSAKIIAVVVVWANHILQIESFVLSIMNGWESRKDPFPLLVPSASWEEEMMISKRERVKTFALWWPSNRRP